MFTDIPVFNNKDTIIDSRSYDTKNIFFTDIPVFNNKDTKIDSRSYNTIYR